MKASFISRRHRSPSPERGQVLVIFALSLIVLLAIAALVVDLGFVVMERRHEQDAADPGALAAARYIEPTADTGKMVEAACFYARQNGYFPNATANSGSGGCLPANDPDGTTLTVNYPPSRSAGGYAGRYGYVEVVLSRVHTSFFAAIIGMPNMTVATSAVAAFDQGTSGSSSLIALNPTQCSSAKIHGGGSGGNVSIFPAAGVTAPGGYVQVNSNCTNGGAIDNICATGSGSGGAGALTLSGGINFSAPAVFVDGTCAQNGTSGTFSGPGGTPAQLHEGAAFVGDILTGLTPPPFGAPTMCPDGRTMGTPAAPAACSLKNAVTMSPGTYYGGWAINTAGASVTMLPGIYVIAGGGITDRGGTLTSAGGQVLIYGTDDPQYATACKAGTAPAGACQDVIKLNGGSTLNLTGLDASGCGSLSACQYAGLLIWQDGSASGAYTANSDVSLAGSNSMYLSGTIYAPSSFVTISGNSVSTGCTPDAQGHTNCAAVQLITDTFDVGGAGTLNMPYDPSKLYHLNMKGLVR
jgi:hypothetical protein